MQGKWENVMKKKNGLDRKDISNYTKIEKNFFNEILSEVTNDDEILKIIDTTEEEPLYYALTVFLTGK